METLTRRAELIRPGTTVLRRRRPFVVARVENVDGWVWVWFAGYPHEPVAPSETTLWTVLGPPLPCHPGSHQKLS